MSEKEFPEGMILKAPREGAPDYVIGSISIRRGDFLAWLESRDGDWVNLNLKRGQSGKFYAEVDNWKPQGKAPPSRPVDSRPQQGRPAPQRGAPPQQFGEPFPGDDIPF